MLDRKVIHNSITHKILQHLATVGPATFTKMYMAYAPAAQGRANSSNNKS